MYSYSIRSSNDVEHTRYQITSRLEGTAGFVESSRTITRTRTARTTCDGYFEAARLPISEDRPDMHGDCGFCAPGDPQCTLLLVPYLTAGECEYEHCGLLVTSIKNN